MTYTIDIYFQSSESVEEVGEALREELRARRPSIVVTSLASCTPAVLGEEWAAYIADAKRNIPPENLMVEIWKNPQMMRTRFELLKEEVVDSRFFEMNSLAVISLFGAEVDWPVVGSIWRVFSTLWRSIAYDQVSGFDIDMFDIPNFD